MTVGGVDVQYLYEYDQSNQLTKVTKRTAIAGEYYYNSEGERYRKVENGKSAYYVYSGESLLYEHKPNIKHLNGAIGEAQRYKMITNLKVLPVSITQDTSSANNILLYEYSQSCASYRTGMLSRSFYLVVIAPYRKLESYITQ